MSDDSHDHEMGYGVVVATTPLALLVRLADDHPDQQFWVPRSVVHDDSEIDENAGEGEEGLLVVKLWWAEKEGWT